MSEKIKVENDMIGLCALPFKPEELEELLNNNTLKHNQTPIDYTNSKFDSNVQFLNYLANCDIMFPLLKNYSLDEKLENLLIEYIRFDRLYNFDALTDMWMAILYKEKISYMPENFESFIESFRSKYPDLITEIEQFFYSLHTLVMNLILPSEKEYEDRIGNGIDSKLKYIGINVLSLSFSFLFCDYMADLQKRDIKMIMFDELVKQQTEGETLVSKFLNIQPNYQLMLLRALVYRDPKVASKFQDIVNALPKDQLKKIKEMHDNLVKERDGK